MPRLFLQRPALALVCAHFEGGFAGRTEDVFDGLMKAGIGLAGFDLGEVRGSPASTAKFTLFYDEMVRRGYAPKQSCSARAAAA